MCVWKNYFKALPGAKANQLNYQTITMKQLYTLVSMICCQVISLSMTCRDISIGLRCRRNNLSKVVISSIAYSSIINTVLMQRLNRALYDECRRNGFTFVDNGAVTENGLMEFICKKAVNALLQII